MQVYPHIEPIETAPFHGTAVAMGYFDGIHIGHRAVIGAAVDWAKAHDAAPAVFTFSLPRDNTLKGSRLISTQDKHALVAGLGVLHYAAPRFEEIRGQSPEEFVNAILQNMHARAVFCGDNFTFGARAAGTVELLKTLCGTKGVEVVVLPMACFEEKTVSSTRIRTALAGGDIPAVNAMLGQPYAIRFPVRHGQGLGAKLGVPTFNQVYPDGFQLPRTGIYITRTCIDGVWYPAATGLGSRPTVNADAALVTCETFVPGFSGDLYDTAPVLEFFSYLAPSRRFDTLDELKACILHAADTSRRYFESRQGRE